MPQYVDTCKLKTIVNQLHQFCKINYLQLIFLSIRSVKMFATNEISVKLKQRSEARTFYFVHMLGT